MPTHCPLKNYPILSNRLNIYTRDREANISILFKAKRSQQIEWLMLSDEFSEGLVSFSAR